MYNRVLLCTKLYFCRKKEPTQKVTCIFKIWVRILKTERKLEIRRFSVKNYLRLRKTSNIQHQTEDSVPTQKISNSWETPWNCTNEKFIFQINIYSIHGKIHEIAILWKNLIFQIKICNIPKLVFLQEISRILQIFSNSV